MTTTAEPPLLARDLMQRDFVRVSPHTPLLSVHRLFVDKQIHGAPVLDDHDNVVGVISTIDLLRVIRRELEPGSTLTRSTYFWDDVAASIDHVEIPESEALWRLIARDAMTERVVSVTPETPIADVAALLIEHRIHRVLVMTASRLDGVLTTFDLLFALVGSHAQVPTARPSGYKR